MKFVFTGGGTGGHFYPVIAVAEKLQARLTGAPGSTADDQADPPQEAAPLYYMAPEAYDEALLKEVGLTYIPIPAGKVRRYFSIANFFDIFRTVGGVLKALWKLFAIYPDVVFAKGAYGSVPVLWAARLLRIPVMIHESDSVPGRANKWAGTFATRIAVSYKEAAEHFPQEIVAHTGQPIRSHLQEPISDGSREHFGIEPETPVLLILGGSQGAKNINSAILNALPQLLNEYVVIHQTGEDNLREVTEVARSVLYGHEHADRYVPRGSLDSTALARAAGITSLVVSRAGSTIFEIARWGIPSIIVPIEDSNGDHQRTNAFAYARTGAAAVIEERNLTVNVFLSEIHRILNQPDVYKQMQAGTQAFVSPDAAETIANELYAIAHKH
ncbi:MAG: UDP-N-acetylglucosamine--N-acetylmuramyl-(pentapeptide) pyrophosphoryl-undecaprenol N-acetylglucosamine transferase [Candidatus Paceibacterota bacterium]